MTLTTAKINSMPIDDVDDLMAQLAAAYSSVDDQYTFNIAASKDEGDDVDVGQFKDWRESLERLRKLCEVILVETKADVG